MRKTIIFLSLTLLFIIPFVYSYETENIFGGIAPKETSYKTLHNYSFSIYEGADYDSLNVYLKNISFFLNLKNCTRSYLYNYCIEPSFDENKPLNCPPARTQPNDAEYCILENCQQKDIFRVCLLNVTLYDYNWSKPDIDKKSTFTIYWGYGVTISTEGAIINATKEFVGYNIPINNKQAKANFELNDEVRIKTSIQNFGSKEGYNVIFRDNLENFDILSFSGCYYEKSAIYWMGNLSPNQRIDCEYMIRPINEGLATNIPIINWTDNTTGTEVEKSWSGIQTEQTINGYLLNYTVDYNNSITKDDIINVKIIVYAKSQIQIDKLIITPLQQTELLDWTIISLNYDSKDAEWKSDYLNVPKFNKNADESIGWNGALDIEKKIMINLTIKIRNSEKFSFLNINGVYSKDNKKINNNVSYSINSSVERLFSEPEKKSAITTDDLKNYEIRMHNPTKYDFYNVSINVFPNDYFDSNNSNLSASIPTIISNTNQLFSFKIILLDGSLENTTMNISLNYTSDVTQKYFVNNYFKLNLTNSTITPIIPNITTTQNITQKNNETTAEKIIDNLSNKDNFPIIIPLIILIALIIGLVVFFRFKRKTV